MDTMTMEIFIGVLKIFSFVVPVLVSVALLVYLERKVLGAVQLRKGSFSKLNCAQHFSLQVYKQGNGD